MSARIRVGGFVLDVPVGGGGHGLVWRGRHEKTALPVAVKVLPPTADRLALHGLKNEVQAIARLHHPHVVAILDTGLIDARAVDEAAALGKPLDPGSPWLALELASGGDLSQVALPLSWGTLSDVLRTLLSALAHAHARGVVHRDLKPANVLLCGSADARPGLKLTDFGLAQREKGARLAGGTPLYMAPEQFDRDSREVGPWTDLYSLGCIAHALVTGAPPFVAQGWVNLEKLHKESAPPAFGLPADFPPGFAAFVQRLLEKDPSARFRCAADADAALALLDRDRPAPPVDRLPDALGVWVDERSHLKRSLEDAATVRRPEAPDGNLRTEALPPRPPTKSARVQTIKKRVGGDSTQSPMSIGAAAPPTSWRGMAMTPLADLRLIEAGLSLWGMRPVPLVGRSDERDALWSALLDVHSARAARLVSLRGPSGVGKSRLVEWMGHRAGELGAALVLRARFSESPARADGLSGLVARVIGLRGLDADAALARAQEWATRWLPQEELLPVELCGLAGAIDGVFPSTTERHGALVRLLSLLARERPLLVWLDDVHWGADAAAFLERVLSDAPELRALFVCTAVDELLSPELRDKLDALQERAVTTTLPIGALDEDAHDELCQLLLGGASTDLVDDLRRRTEGNPMFAVHVVGDWVQRGLLEVSPGGLTLKDGVAASLPVELFGLWDQKLATATTGLGAGTLRALEIAAVLGSAVDLVEWEAATELPRDALDALVDALVSAGLARRTAAGFAFVHVLLRGAIERQADAAQSLPGAHRAAAAALSLLWGTETPIAAARIGRHLLAAGDAEQAAALLLRAARVAVDEGEILEAGSILVDWDKARRARAIGDADPRAAQGLFLRGQVATAEGRHAEALVLARAAERAAKDPALAVQAACLEGRAHVGRGEPALALACFERARARASKSDDAMGVGLALLGLGEAEYYRGDRTLSATHYRAANAILSASGRQHDVAQLLWALGYIELDEGRPGAARKFFDEKRALCRAIRDRLGEANAENALGELARTQNDLVAAEAHYRAALRIATRSGLSRRWTFRLNLAHTRVCMGDIQAGALMAAELLEATAARSDPTIAGAAWWIVAHGAASRGDLVAYDKAAEGGFAIGQGAYVSEDLILEARLAGDAVAAFDRDRAERAWQFARDKARVLGRPTEPKA